MSKSPVDHIVREWNENHFLRQFLEVYLSQCSRSIHCGAAVFCDVLLLWRSSVPLYTVQYFVSTM